MDAPLTTSSLFANTPLLPADVTLIILEELQKIQHISNLRVVSKQFNALIVPLAYRRVRLTDRSVAPFALKQELYDPSIVQLQVARYVRHHTRHLTVDRRLDWSLVANLVRSMANLKSFTWAFWDIEERSLCRSVNSTVGPALYETWPNVQLHFESVYASTKRSWIYLDFPKSKMVTCTIAVYERPDLLRIRKLLFDRPRLQKLHLVNRRNELTPPDNVTFEINGDQIVTHLPALKELIIDGYEWTHSLWGSNNLWNWSNITHLELRNINVTNFLHKVQPHRLSGLKVFIEKCACDSMHGKKTIGLYNLLMHTTALEELEIRYHAKTSDITSIIARNSSHLRILKLRCFYLHFETWRTILTAEQLKTIGSGCPQLMEMAIDLTLPSGPASSKAKSKIAETSPSTIMTRSMSRLQEVKHDAIGRDGEDSKDGEAGKSAAQSTIPSWYMYAYLEEIPCPGSVCMARTKGLERTAKKQGIDLAQALYEYELWKQNHSKELVAAFAIPASALAQFRNLRRLTVFTSMKHFVAPESREKTYSRTRAAVENWINELLLMKEGAGFEKVVVHVRSEVVNEEDPVDRWILESTYEYAGKRSVGGDIDIREDIFLF